jgi:acetyl-CoA carboxylase carboxyltransferase component
MDTELIAAVHTRRAAVLAQTPEDKVARLRAEGKLPVRERLEVLLDPGSFREIGLLARSQLPELRERTPADGLVCGSGSIAGRPVYVIADDPLVLAGTRGRVAEAKTARVRALALAERAPLIVLSEAGAARLQETRGALAAGLGEGFAQQLRLSGRVPLVAVMLGAGFGGPSFQASISDVTFQVRGTGFIGMSGPKVVKVGIGQEVTAEQIGGVQMSAETTGQAHVVGEGDAETLRAVRRYLSYFPAHSEELPPRVPARPAPCETPEGAAALAALVPENQRRAYSAHRLLELIADEGSLFELSAAYGRSMVTALGRLGGQVVGFVANNPAQGAGALTEKTANKQRRFIDLCDAYHIPLVFFTDTPGFLVGPEIEKQRMVSLCGRLMNSLLSASVPKLTIVLRKAVGMAYLAMCGRSANPALIAAWPTAFFDVMGPEAGVMLLHDKEIAAAPDPAARKQEILASLAAQAAATEAAALGLIDDVITPGETRQRLLETLARASGAQRPGFRHRIDP